MENFVKNLLNKGFAFAASIVFYVFSKNVLKARFK